MIKIQDVLDFIGSKRPKYKMENWINFNYRTDNFAKYNIIPLKDENGNVGYYNNENKKEGYWGKYIKNGNLLAKGNYVDGKEEGEWLLKKNLEFNEFFELVYFEEGKIVHDIKEKGFKVYYDDKFVKYYKIWDLYFKPKIDNSGNELGYFNDNDKLEGKWEGFFSDYSLIYKVNFVNGVLDGDFEKYYRNGNLRSKGNYVNGNQEGLWLTDRTSSIYLQAVIIKNNEIVKYIKEKGFEVYYDDKFIKYYKINYDFYTPEIDSSGNKLGYLNDNGFQEGKWKIYNNQGFLESGGNFKNGNRDGEWKFFDYYNKSVSICTYKNGKYISDENF